MAQLPLQYDLVVYRGDSFERTITLKSGGDTVDLSTAEIDAQCRLNRELTARQIFAFSIEEIDFEEGRFKIKLAPSDTAKVRDGTYAWDLQVKQNGDVVTWLSGDLELSPDVTRI